MQETLGMVSVSRLFWAFATLDHRKAAFYFWPRTFFSQVLFVKIPLCVRFSGILGETGDISLWERPEEKENRPNDAHPESRTQGL